MKKKILIGICTIIMFLILIIPHQSLAVTFGLTLSEDFWSSSLLDVFAIFVIILCTIFVLIAFRLWAKYGKNKQVVETVEFYPPEGYNSAEVGFLYNGTVNREGIMSLLIYLANKGYLRIEETEEETFLKSKGCKITKIKEYDGDNEYEKLFFDGLFNEYDNIIDVDETEVIIDMTKDKKKEIGFEDAVEMPAYNYNNKSSVTNFYLFNSFYKTLDKIKSKMNSIENKDKIFESKASGQIKYLILMIIAIFFLITVRPVIEYGLRALVPRNSSLVASFYMHTETI